MFGEQLREVGVARIVGIDFCEEAREACERDRRGFYDAYLVLDLCDVDDDQRRERQSWRFDCLSCVAALGFSDIPALAFAHALNLISVGGWIAFNIKDTFLLDSDTSGFSTLIKNLPVTDTLAIHHLGRYKHRVSIDGRPLFYCALIGRKERDIPEYILASLRRAG